MMYEGISWRAWTCHLDQKWQLAQVSNTKWCNITLCCVSLVSFGIKSLCVPSRLIFTAVHVQGNLQFSDARSERSWLWTWKTMPETHKMKSHNEITAMWASFPGCPRLSGKTADHPTCNSRKSAPVVLPAVAEMLDLIHTQEGTTTKGKTMTNKKGKHTAASSTQSGNFWICSHMW